MCTSSSMTSTLYKNVNERTIRSLIRRHQQEQVLEQLVSQCHHVNQNAIYFTTSTSSVSSSLSVFFSSLSTLLLGQVTSKSIPLCNHEIQHKHYQRLNPSAGNSTSISNCIITFTTSAKIPSTGSTETATSTIPSLTESDTGTAETTTTAPEPTKTIEKFLLPIKPTWSINSLQLHINHEPISYNELKILSKRAVIDIDTMNSTQIKQLQQNVGNMLHMINQVTVLLSNNNNESETTNTTTMTNDDDEEQEIQQLRQQKDLLTTVDLYDIPRGVYAAPLRGDDNINNNNYKTVIKKENDTIDENDTLQKQKQQQQQNEHEQQEKLYKEYENVWTSYLQPNTKRIGSHDYFVLASSASSLLTTTKSTISTKSLSSTDDDE